MKRVILSTVLFLGIASFASAQTATGNSSRTTGAVSSTGSSKKGKKATKPSERLNNRKEYNFRNGQQATPTGQEATPVGGGYSALGKDTSSGNRRKQ